MGTPNREPQDCSRNSIEYKDPGGYIPIIFLLYSWGFPVWGSQYSPSYPILKETRLAYRQPSMQSPCGSFLFAPAV